MSTLGAKHTASNYSRSLEGSIGANLPRPGSKHVRTSAFACQATTDLSPQLLLDRRCAEVPFYHCVPAASAQRPVAAKILNDECWGKWVLLRNEGWYKKAQLMLRDRMAFPVKVRAWLETLLTFAVRPPC